MFVHRKLQYCLLPRTDGFGSMRYTDNPEAVLPGYGAVSVRLLLDVTWDTARRLVLIRIVLPAPSCESNSVPEPATTLEP
jgi:hypothetical protein